MGNTCNVIVKIFIRLKITIDIWQYILFKLVSTLQTTPSRWNVKSISSPLPRTTNSMISSFDVSVADSWPLEVYPESGPSIGGFELIISGPCMEPNTVVTCQFGEVTFADGYVLDDVRAGCVVPELFHVGVIPIIVTIGGTEYTSEITLGIYNTY